LSLACLPVRQVACRYFNLPERAADKINARLKTKNKINAILADTRIPENDKNILR